MKTPTATTTNSVPSPFIQRYGKDVIGVLQGFDRLRFRGTLRHLYCPSVMEAYLNACRILIKDFAQMVERTTRAVKEKAQALAAAAKRPVIFVPSSQTSKEELVREIARKDGVTEGLIAVLSAVEPCQSFRVKGNPETKKIELELTTRKCTHLYFYYEHLRFGFMHLRLQTWFPFQVNLWINGRHWLGRQLDQAGISYQKKGNTFLRIADLARAQELIDQQLCRHGQRYRGLSPWSKQDSLLLELVNRGEFALNGFRNRDLCRAFFKPTTDLVERKRRMGWMCRRLRLLRAHGLVQKVTGTNRYVVSDKGRPTITALLAARKANVEQLTKPAA